MSPREFFKLTSFALVLLSVTASDGFAQAAKPKQIHPDSLIEAAREIIGLQKYCALATIDSAGRPRIRTMNPFPPEGDMTIWMATNSRSRKADEIRGNPTVSLYYADHARATGYVNITGKAYLVDDMQEKLNRKREYGLFLRQLLDNRDKIIINQINRMIFFGDKTSGNHIGKRGNFGFDICSIGKIRFQRGAGPHKKCGAFFS